jgi:serine/threonine protein kinase/tetratricopeptide (TPR) repeat protein
MTGNQDDNTRTHLVLSEGTMVSHYRIVEKIGAGGMGEVYLAEDTKLNRRVALKFLPVNLVAKEDVRTRFVREARTIAKLNHPNIVAVYDVSDVGGRPFYVMELVEGENLHHYAHEKPLPIDLIVEYTLQICQGLGEAHRAGIIHRDIKAANIAVDNKGRVRLLDFGLAAHEEDDRITKTGSTLGTVSYMAPEQVSGRGIDHRSDLFSLGIVLYELIAGRTPFKRDSEGATLKAIMEDNPEPLTRYKSDVPEKLQEVVSKLLEKDKELRYQSAEGVMADLKRLVYDSQQTGFVRATPSSSSKKGLLAGVAAVALIAVVAITYFLSRPAGRATSKADAVPMIAVLPFENLGSPDDEYFADGMTDEITSRLAVIDGLGVISRTSAMKYRESDKTLKEIGSDLGVEYVLEGTVRWSRVGDQPRIRITPQLVRVSDDRHMWADNYERALMEVFAVQAEIAERIVEQLGMTLLPSDKANLASRPTENPKAYQLYLKALNAKRRLNWEWEELDPRANIDSAVILDSSFALAHALRSEFYSTIAFSSPSSDAARIAYESARKALELQPGLPQGHMALGKYYHRVETDYTRAMEEFSMARSELHNDAELLSAIAYLQMRQGKFAEAQANRRRAAELDPLNPARYRSLAENLGFTRMYDEAELVINQAIAMEPERAWNYAAKVDLYVARYGDIERVKPIVDEALDNCDTLEFAALHWDLKDYLPDLSWDSLVVRNIQWERDSADSEWAFYFSVMQMLIELGDVTLITAYADSSKNMDRQPIEGHPENPFANAYSGLVLAYLGNCDQAIELGLRGKERLSVDDCHY